MSASLALYQPEPAPASEEVVTMIHDLASPTATIISMADGMLAGLDGPLNERQRERLQRIQRVANYLLQLGRDVLTAARLDQGRVSLLLERHNLVDLTSAAVEMARPQARAKDVQVRVLPCSAAVEAEVDELKMTRVLSNLIFNAIKFSSPGQSVEASVRTEGDCAVIAVRDTGPGIPEHETPKLFRKFSTTSVSATRGERGTGLGLYIAQRIVQLHGGSIRVRTEVGRGSTFEVVLPSHLA